MIDWASNITLVLHPASVHSQLQTLDYVCNYAPNLNRHQTSLRGLQLMTCCKNGHVGHHCVGERTVGDPMPSARTDSPR